jgi:hypothetical protein
MSKEKKPDGKPSGRIAFDDRGNATWEWQTDTGTFTREIDTKRMKALQESAAAGLAPEPSAVTDAGSDPYSSADRSSTTEGRTTRRTLNDMRQLSEQIIRDRAAKKLPPKT